MRLLGDDQRATLAECEADARGCEAGLRAALLRQTCLEPSHTEEMFRGLDDDTPHRPVFAGAMTPEQRERVAEWFYGQFEMHGDNGDWELAIEYQNWRAE